MTLTLHIIVDNCPPERLDRAVKYLKNVKQAKYVNIGAGAQLDRGMQFVDRVKAERPDIKVIWRNLNPEDTGMHTKKTPIDCYNYKVRPNLTWFKKHSLIYMPDNESSGDDNTIRRYAAWEAEMAGLLHADGLRGAFCRFATGNIAESQYALLKPIFNAMIPGDIISPNEYSEAPGYQPPSAGHLARYENMWVAAGKHLETVIGEAGICVGYDAGKGYQSIGMSGSVYGQQMLNENVWYESGKIDRCLYLIGGYSHESFRLGDDVLNFLENHYVNLPTQPPIITPPPVVTPPPTPTPEPPPVVVIPPGPLTREACLDFAAAEDALSAVHSRQAARWRQMADSFEDGLLTVA